MITQPTIEQLANDLEHRCRVLEVIRKPELKVNVRHLQLFIASWRALNAALIKKVGSDHGS